MQTYHPGLASQWASKNISTSPLAAWAPATRARINPERSSVRTILTTLSGQVSAM